MTEPTDIGLPGRFISDPDREFSTWKLVDIYMGPLKSGKYVPNVDDLVLDWEQGFFRVATVDYTTGLSDLRPWTIKTSPTEISDEDVLLGVGPGDQSEMWRVYIDKRTVPYTVNVEARLHVHGSAATVYKLFKGTNITANGEVISAFYDQNGMLLGENIPMELVANEYVSNRAVKAPMQCHTTANLLNGEVVTIVVYGLAGNQVYRTKLLVEETSLVRRADASLKYVTGIHLESPFLAESDPNLIEFPININIETVMMQGVVTYSNGSRKLIPITEDGASRMSLYGLRNYVPTQEGQKIDLTLDYVLAPDEYSYIQGPTENGSITERYFARTTKVDKAYSVKLFAYPTWRDVIVGYQLDFWLYNLDRREYQRVPRNLVEVQAGSRNFDGLDMITTQHLSVSLNLSAVDIKYSSYRHVQTFNISLRSSGDVRRTNWMVGFNPNSPVMYGEDLEAVLSFIDTNYWLVNIGNKMNSKEEWLRKVFYATAPLYDLRSEIEAPEPTHFALRTKTRRTEFTIAQWNNDLQLFNDLDEGESLYIEFFRRTPSTDLQLGVSALPVHMLVSEVDV
jgi:hypothetical protein